MRVIDAVWEKRNLGVDAVEIIVEACDSIEEIVRVLDQYNDVGYTVVKCPSDYPEAVATIQISGFSMIEATMSLSIKTTDLKVHPRFEGLIQRCSYSEMSENDIEFMEDQIRKGLFSTDRISIDPVFSREIASRRYINWIRDLIKKGTPCIKVLFDGNPVGFFISSKISDTVYDGVLAAVYESFMNSGMGYFVQWAGVDYVRSLGAKKYLGHISLNNPSVLKILLSLGYNNSNIQYVFVRHGGF